MSAYTARFPSHLRRVTVAKHQSNTYLSSKGESTKAHGNQGARQPGGMVTQEHGLLATCIGGGGDHKARLLGGDHARLLGRGLGLAGQRWLGLAGQCWLGACMFGCCGFPIQ